MSPGNFDLRKSKQVRKVRDFNEVYEEFAPIISIVLRKAKVYKNHDYYHHIATIAMWEAFENYDPARGKFEPFVYRCMLTAVIDEMRAENLYGQRMICFEKEKLEFLSNVDVSKERAQLDCLMSVLNEEEVELLSAHYIEGYSYREISKKLGVSISALRKRRDRAMKKIRDSFGV